jgi:hypothetical protein
MHQGCRAAIALAGSARAWRSIDNARLLNARVQASILLEWMGALRAIEL